MTRASTASIAAGMSKSARSMRVAVTTMESRASGVPGDCANACAGMVATTTVTAVRRCTGSAPIGERRARSITHGDVRSLLSVCIGGARCNATLSKTGATGPATLDPMDTIASRWHLVLLQCAILAVLTVGAHLMVASLPG